MSFQKKLLRAFFLGLTVSTMLFPGLTKAAVSPNTAEFGDVLIGDSAKIPVYITNLESENSLMVFFVLKDGTVGFSTAFNMIELQPFQTLCLDVQYSPLTVGAHSDVLSLLYQNGQSETVLLTGQGVEAEEETRKEEEQMGIEEDVLPFFDQSVADGTLRGTGPGKSADKRLHALRNMIVHAGNLMECGAFEEAYGQLRAVLKKIEDTGSPKKSSDFANGEAAERLAAMIKGILGNGALFEF